jgi:hypothetical protein
MRSQTAAPSQKTRRVRFPRHLSLHSVFDYLKRAHPAVPQPVKRINEALTFLEDLGFWFVWTGAEWGLQCRGCGMAYVRSGHTRNHKCSSGPLGATSSELAKNPQAPLEASEVSDPMLRDRPDAETSFEHVKEATDGQPSSEPDLSAEDVHFPIEVVALQRAGPSE